MFESPKLQNNRSYFAEVTKLLADHNDISYKKLTLATPEVEFDFVNYDKKKYTNPVALEIIAFYNEFMSQSIAINNLEVILESMSYTDEDLTININRSHDAILKIFSSLVDTKIKLSGFYDQLKMNLQSVIKSFIRYIKSMVSANMDSEDVASIITVIYKCMLSKGLQRHINVDDRKFIEIGYALIEILYDAKVLAKEHCDLIKKLNDELKQIVLLTSQVAVSDHDSITRFQTFGIVPDEGDNESLNTIMEKLFGVSDARFESIDKSFDLVDQTLKSYERQSGVSTGMIVFVSSNEDNYFNLSGLLNDDKLFESEGVTEQMIKTFDILKTNKNTRTKKNDIIQINIEDSTKQAYLLWTNDLQTFKYKASPTCHIKKILRKTSSEAIDAYNGLLTRIIESQKGLDAIAFNKVKYMSFNNVMTEERFLKNLETTLTSLIISVAKQSKKKQFDIDLLTDISRLVLDKIDLMKNDFGVSFSSHTMIIYTSMADKIVRSLKKQLLNQSISNDLVNETVSIIVNSNDNIYSRTIASYYLHIA